MTVRHQARGADLWPVREGDTWQVGPHLLRCGDLTAGLGCWLAGRPVDLVYADPPWRNADLQRYRSAAGLDRAPYDWAHLYGCVTRLREGAPTYLEAAAAAGALVKRHLHGPHTAAWTLRADPYRVALLYTGWAPSPVTAQMLDGCTEARLPERVLAAHTVSAGRPGTVLDPCAGLGATARAAHATGWHLLGNELDPCRLSCTLHVLQRLTGHTPERIDSRR